MLLCHGTPKSNTRSIIDPDWSLVADGFKPHDLDAIIAGHHHHHWSDIIDKTLLALAGSGGMPCGGDTRAQYTILDLSTDGVRWHPQSVEYERHQFIADLKAHDYVNQTAPIGWLELSQVVTARPLMLYYFRDRFDVSRGPDLEFLAWSVREHLKEYDALTQVEAEFGPLTI